MTKDDTHPSPGLSVPNFDPASLRQTVRSWLDQHAKPLLGQDDPWRDPQQDEIDALHRDRVGTVDWARNFQRRLYDAGLAALSWPPEYGGRGLPPEADDIYQEEASDFFVPRITLGVSLNMVRHVILAHGNEQQKGRYLKPLLRADEIWCQLFSEPGSGSDLAGLRFRAVRDGDEFHLNGQKVWTSGAQYADFGLLLARTNVDVPKHSGITAFLLDMHSPGITVRPLRQATGASHFNEVFFDDVVIPTSQVLGRVDQGWRVAITTLMHERGSGTSKRADLARPVIAAAQENGMSKDPATRQRLAALWIRGQIVAYHTHRIATERKMGRDPGPQGSLLKLAGARLAQDAAQLGMEVTGPGGAAWEPDAPRGNRWAEAVMATRRLSIAGGTDEIQRNIVGERLLALPKDPGDDSKIPFKARSGIGPLEPSERNGR